MCNEPEYVIDSNTSSFVNKEELILLHQLTPHPEGGYYKEMWRSSLRVQTPFGERSAGTAIYFLLETERFSAFHRLVSDELWYFHHGSPADIYIIHEDGRLEIVTIGSEYHQGQSLQLIVPAGAWFAAEVKEKGSYTFVSCSVSPGFEFTDFELSDKSKLSEAFPAHAELIARLCR